MLTDHLFFNRESGDYFAREIYIIYFAELFILFVKMSKISDMQV